MADFDVKVVRVTEVYSHPDADRLSIVKTTAGDFICISAKLDDGSHRYQVGDLVVYIPEQAVMPEWMMKDMDFWDINKDKPAFRYVKAKKLRGIFSQGILYQLDNRFKHNPEHKPMWDMFIPETVTVEEGQDVGELLNIIKYEPVVPATMRGQMSGAYLEHTMKYDFDSIQKQQDIFDDMDWVVATEKLHGTLIQIIYVPNLNDEFGFGESKNILVTSKGMGAKGFVYKNVPENDTNLYVRVLKQLLEQDLENKLKVLSCHFTPPKDDIIHLFGEVCGEGIQDLSYGFKAPTPRFFDMAINKEFQNLAIMNWYYSKLGLETVPQLYYGVYDKEKLLTFRDGKDTISESHIREGIVMKTLVEGQHPKHGRKIAKWISPDYLLRKNGTEFN